jgi:acetoacetyl-CoA synthetase
MTVSYAPPPEAVAVSELTAFIRHCERQTGDHIPDQAELHRLWVRDYRRYWSLFLRWAGLPCDGELEPACVGEEVESAAFFPNLRLSYAGSLLRHLDETDDERPAITSISEARHNVWLSRGELREDVLRIGAGLRALDLSPGEAVVALASNSAHTVEACLASVSLGAVWAAADPELTTGDVVARFRPLEPVVLFAHSEAAHGAQRRSLRDRLRAVVDALPSLRAVVLLDSPHASLDLGVPERSLEALLSAQPGADPWPRFAFDHPLFVLFTSGEAPEGVVHGVGGTLLEQHKEHVLHADLGPGDRLLLDASVGTSAWVWQLAALACGTEIVLYDGTAAPPPDNALWRAVAQEKVTVFGTSASYLRLCRAARTSPTAGLELGALRAVLCSGSAPLELHEWVAANVGALPLQEMHAACGMVGCFALGSPNLPVYAGESSCASLGLDLRVVPADETSPPGEGRLVCAQPFPSRPLGLVSDVTGSRFHDTYFAPSVGFWSSGEVVELTDRGTLRVLARSGPASA